MVKQYEDGSLPERESPELLAAQQPAGVSVTYHTIQDGGLELVTFDVWSNGERPYSHALQRIGGSSKIFQAIHDVRVSRARREAFKFAEQLASNTW